VSAFLGGGDALRSWRQGVLVNHGGKSCPPKQAGRLAAWSVCMASRLFLLVMIGAAMLADSPARASRFTTLSSFAEAPGRLGAAGNPYAGLVRGPSGTLYGTLYAGGAGGAGAVFMLSPPLPGHTSWTQTLIHHFSAKGAADGAHPMGALILGEGGVLIGTTSAGGGAGNAGGGTVFALHPPPEPGGAWRETVLSVFPSVNGVGAAPAARLFQDENGALYGTTTTGGIGFGSVFRLAPPSAPGLPWSRTDLHVFRGDAEDGGLPLSGLTQGADLALYGTAQAAAGDNGGGTIYRLAPEAGSQGQWRKTVVFRFPAGGAYGSQPVGDLIIDGGGALYGAASSGGAKGAGIVFRLNPPALGGVWTFSLLYSFTGHFGDGGPQGGVAFGRHGTLVGTTASAARLQQGTVFQIIPGMDAAQSWSETVLARFPTRPAGGGLFPVGDLVGDGRGDFFGVTETGGAGGVGTVFEVAP
jgi:uncharacterized repeat protein (TIGR03803 family)